MNAVVASHWTGSPLCARGLRPAGRSLAGAATRRPSLDLSPPKPPRFWRPGRPANVDELAADPKAAPGASRARFCRRRRTSKSGRAAGSGVIVSPEGLVLTAAHVIGRPGRRAWVELPDGRRLRGHTLGADHDADAGMLQTRRPAQRPAVRPGQRGTAAGARAPGWSPPVSPAGSSRAGAPPVRLGRVLFRDDDMLCTDCKLVGGDSGGPLFNMQGRGRRHPQQHRADDHAQLSCADHVVPQRLDPAARQRALGRRL